MRTRAVMIFLVLSSGAFAQELSGGLAVSGGWFVESFSVSNSSLSVSSDLAGTFLPLRAEAFLDGRYFSAALGFKVSLAGHTKQTQTVSGTTSTVTDVDVGTRGYVTLALYAKYPFPLGPVLLFPILGLEIDTNVLYLDAGGNDVRGTLTPQQLSNENQAWVKAGVGADWPFSRSGYLRAVLIFAYKFNNSSENAAVENATSAGFNATLFTIQPDLVVGVGFRL